MASRPPRQARPPPTAESVEAWKQQQRAERELSAFAKSSSRVVNTLAAAAIIPPRDVGKYERSAIAEVNDRDGVSSGILPPSWQQHLVAPEPVLTFQQQQQKQDPYASVYPPPIPPLTAQQLANQQRMDLLTTTTSAAMTTVNVSAAAGAEALNFMGNALSLVVPKVVMDAPAQVGGVFQSAAETVGLDLMASLDLSPLEPEAAKALAVLEKHGALRGFALGMKRLILVLRRFRFNRVAASHLLRLCYAILGTFTKPKVGVLANENRPLIDPSFKPYIARVEETIFRAERFLLKFASEDDGDLGVFGLAYDPNSGLFSQSTQSSTNPQQQQQMQQLINTLNAQKLRQQQQQQPAGQAGSPTTNGPTSSWAASTALLPLMAPTVQRSAPAAQNVVGSQNFVCDSVTMLQIHKQLLDDFAKKFYDELLKSYDEFLGEVGFSLAIFDISKAVPDFRTFGDFQTSFAMQGAASSGPGQPGQQQQQTPNRLPETESEFSRKARRSGSLDEVQLIGGVTALKKRLSDTKAFVRDRLQVKPTDLFTSGTVKAWWAQFFGVKQRVTSEEFIKFAFWEAGGKLLVKTSRLRKMESVLVAAVANLDMDTDKLVHISEFAIFFNAVGAGDDETDFFNILELASNLRRNFKIVIMPSMPANVPKVDGVYRLAWNDYQEVRLGRFLIDNFGWSLVSGPRGSGKSVRVLSILQSLPRDRDVLYVDLNTCKDIGDVVSAVTSQFMLKSCRTFDGFSQNLRDLLQTKARFHATVVFDNLELENLSVEASNALIRGFKAAIRAVCAPFARKCHFVVVSSTFPKLDKTMKEFLIPALSDTQANFLARELLPNDPASLVIAGRRLAGDMARLASSCSLSVVRKVAAIYTVDEGATLAAKKCIVEGTESDMTPDQLLCAACMLTDLQHFSEGHAWALCRAAFQDDVLRWRIAWQGLVEIGWVSYSQPLGYWIPPTSIVSKLVVVSNDTTISLDTQVRAYLLYWAEQIVRVGSLTFDAEDIILVHDRYRAHFRSVMLNFLLIPEGTSPQNYFQFVGSRRLNPGSFGARFQSVMQTLARTTPRLKDPNNSPDNFSFVGPRWVNPKKDLVDLAQQIAGGLERVLNARYAPEFAEAVTSGVKSTLLEIQGLSYMRACRDHALQLLRLRRVGDALLCLQQQAATVLMDKAPGAMPYDRGMFAIAMAIIQVSRAQTNEAKTLINDAKRHLNADLALGPSYSSEFTPGTLAFVDRAILHLGKSGIAALFNTQSMKIGETTPGRR